MSAPGPWTRFERAVRAARGNPSKEGMRRELAAALLDNLPDPREADLAGEALDALRAAYDDPDSEILGEEWNENARSILRRAGRI